MRCHLGTRHRVSYLLYDFNRHLNHNMNDDDMLVKKEHILNDVGNINQRALS